MDNNKLEIALSNVLLNLFAVQDVDLSVLDSSAQFDIENLLDSVMDLVDAYQGDDSES